MEYQASSPNEKRAMLPHDRRGPASVWTRGQSLGLRSTTGHGCPTSSISVKGYLRFRKPEQFRYNLIGKLCRKNQCEGLD